MRKLLGLTLAVMLGAAAGFVSSPARAGVVVGIGLPAPVVVAPPVVGVGPVAVYPRFWGYAYPWGHPVYPGWRAGWYRGGWGYHGYHGYHGGWRR